MADQNVVKKDFQTLVEDFKQIKSIITDPNPNDLDSIVYDYLYPISEEIDMYFEPILTSIASNVELFEQISEIRADLADEAKLFRENCRNQIKEHPINSESLPIRQLLLELSSITNDMNELNERIEESSKTRLTHDSDLNRMKTQDILLLNERLELLKNKIYQVLFMNQTMFFWKKTQTIAGNHQAASNGSVQDIVNCRLVFISNDFLDKKEIETFIK